MITGIPHYTDPIEQSVRCLCGLRYLVLMREGLGDYESRAKERAKIIHARFIDARQTPFMVCRCGEFLDFMPEASLMVM